MKQHTKLGFLLIVLLFLSWLSVFHFVPSVYATTETRYFTNENQGGIFRGFLSTANAGVEYHYHETDNQRAYFCFLIFRGTTLIGGNGTFNNNYGVGCITATSTRGLRSATWDCPDQSEYDPDYIEVQAWQCEDATGYYPEVEIGYWRTSETNVILNASTWTFNFDCQYVALDYNFDVYWGQSTYTSYISNFAWTAGPTEAPAEDYVDDQSNVDSVADVGTHGNFTAQQDANILYNDTLTETNTNTTYEVYSENYVDNDASNVDSHANHGTSSNFTAEQDSNMLYNDTLTEANTGTPIAEAWITPNNYVDLAWTNENKAYDNTDNTWATSNGITTHAWSAYLYLNFTTTTGSKIEYLVQRSSTRVTTMQIDVFTTSWTNIFSATPTYNSWTNTSAFTQKVGATCMRYKFYNSFVSGTYYAYVNETKFLQDASANTNYELDYEFQWTTADFAQTDAYLCIRTDTFIGTAESLGVDVWTGTPATWVLVSNALIASQWNNISISDYLNQSTITFRFIGKNEVSDTNQNTWVIECNLICVSTGGINYELQIEEEFTSANYTRTSEELCIRMGTMNGETLLVQWWNTTASAWLTIIASLSANTWNNVSVTAYLTSDTFYIRFLDGTTSGDGSQSTWDKDACLLHTWEGAAENFDPTNDACDSTATFSVNVDAWVNMTVTDQNLVADLYEVNINITTANSKIVILNWTQSTNTFAEVLDVDNLCTLNTSSSTKVNIDTDTDQVCFFFKLSAGTQKGNCNVTATTTDDDSATDTDTYTNEFTIAFYSSISIGTSTHQWTNATAGTTNQLIDETWINFTVTSNTLFKIRAQGSGNLLNSSYSIGLGNVTIHKDTLGSAVSLTTSYGDVGGWTSQSMGENLALYVKLWLSVPSTSEPWLDYVYTLYIQVTEA